eukprot:CAMPEP_0114543712 /NCGR_PEP_ID=MMETSP0114-20121206/2502_1 /TAXON_ID=31324 /ORGANISM="Goniomonas sp, Strain m" /LENGTH=269 /DNA_ID=CAMNT_0001728069 /DNA_START=57 /DNA_END=862 /DNA_ORIENTATION=-
MRETALRPPRRRLRWAAAALVAVGIACLVMAASLATTASQRDESQTSMANLFYRDFAPNPDPSDPRYIPWGQRSESVNENDDPEADEAGPTGTTVHFWPSSVPEPYSYSSGNDVYRIFHSYVHSCARHLARAHGVWGHLYDHVYHYIHGIPDQYPSYPASSAAYIPSGWSYAPHASCADIYEGRCVVPPSGYVHPVSQGSPIGYWWHHQWYSGSPPWWFYMYHHITHVPSNWYNWWMHHGKPTPCYNCKYIERRLAHKILQMWDTWVLP